MKAVRVVLVALLVASLTAPTLIAEPRQLLQGTQIRLQLVTDISTGAAKVATRSLPSLRNRLPLAIR